MTLPDTLNSDKQKGDFKHARTIRHRQTIDNENYLDRAGTISFESWSC